MKKTISSFETKMLKAAAAPFFFLPLFISSSSFVSRLQVDKVRCFSKMSPTPPIPGPLIPKFVPVEISDISSANRPDGNQFSLVSYNILAQVYVKSAFFPHSPGPCLKWKARSQAILAVLKSMGADFFCLQEVDEYDTFYKQNMEKLGYSSTYVKRSGQKRDGCGIFYKSSSAELVFEEKIYYNDLVKLMDDVSALSVDKDVCSTPSENAGSELINDSVSDIQEKGDRGDPNDPRIRLKRDCVGIMAVFKLKDPSPHHVIIANTHLYWDPEWADVKLAQAEYLLSRIVKFKQLVLSKLGSSPPVIIAGDFNSVPGDKVYQYLVSGAFHENLDDEPVPLSSVYAQTRGEPHFTNCTPGFTGTLDYILFSSSGVIRPVSFLELPEPESPDVVGGLPNYHHPSDHLPIGAEFEVLE